MLYYITFYYTFSVIVIVSHLKVPNLNSPYKTLQSETLPKQDNFVFLVITFPALENKCSLATDVAGTASSRLATAALLLTDTFSSLSPSRTVDFGCAKVSRLGELSCQLLTHDLSQFSVITLLRLQLMVCFTHISCKNRNREKPKPRFSVKTDRNRTGNGILEL